MYVKFTVTYYTRTNARPFYHCLHTQVVEIAEWNTKGTRHCALVVRRSEKDLFCEWIVSYMKRSLNSTHMHDLVKNRVSVLVWIHQYNLYVCLLHPYTKYQCYNMHDCERKTTTLMHYFTRFSNPGDLSLLVKH